MRAEFDVRPETFAFEAEPGEFEAWQAEAPRRQQPQPNRGSADYIRWLQAALNRILGLNLAVDGIIGAQTRSAIRTFQQRRGLTTDGIVGPATEAALIAAGAPRPGGAAPATAAPCPPRSTSARCPAAGPRPSVIVDYFAFDSAQLNADCHALLIDDAARRVVQSQGSTQPIRSIRIVGHADASGRESYNVRLGRQRAEAVLLQLCRTLEPMSPGVTRAIRFELASCGETQTKATPELSRRVEIFLPTPPAPAGCQPFTERIRLHVKVRVQPTVAIATMLASMRQVYEPAGFLVELVSCEVLQLPTPEVLDVHCPGSTTQTCCPFPCASNNLNANHVALFQNRNNVGTDELAIYFVRQIVPQLRGCCAHPPGRPGAAVGADASQWTLAHEVGHVLGLRHVCDTDRLMIGGRVGNKPCGNTDDITNLPPDLIASEIQTMQQSNLTIPC